MQTATPPPPSSSPSLPLPLVRRIGISSRAPWAGVGIGLRYASLPLAERGPSTVPWVRLPEARQQKGARVHNEIVCLRGMNLAEKQSESKWGREGVGGHIYFVAALAFRPLVTHPFRDGGGTGGGFNRCTAWP